MAVRRKVFRIEQASGMGAVSVRDGEAARRDDEFMAEIRALRSLIEPPGPPDRDALEKSRAQIAEVQAYKAELGLIYAAVKLTRDEIETFGVDPASLRDMARAGRELEAIVSSTEQATQQVLQAAEGIDQAANTLSAALKSEHEQGLASDIRDRVVQIFEACNFQDLTGQRVGRVVEILAMLEEHVGRLMEIWRRVEQFKPVVLDEPVHDERHFLNGPRLPGDAGHSSQEDIDALFGGAQ